MKKIQTLLFICLFSINSIAQDTKNDTINQNSNLKLYYDCNYCDVTFIKQNLRHVEFVRDRKFAEIHLLITEQQNGSGGARVTLQFIGVGVFNKLSDTLSYSTNPNMTADDKRRKQLKYIEFGLMRFFIEKGMVNKFDLNYTDINENKEEKIIDPWRNWVFKMSVSGWFSGQETSSNSNINGSFSAKRITEKNKFNLWSNLFQRRSKYTFGNDIVSTFQQNLNLYASDVITINKHWSYGVFSSASNSIFSNYKLSTSVRTGIEYNIFPYSESATKQAVVYYTIGPRYNNYFDTTIYNKTSELLLEHSILVGTSFKQKWGNLRASIQYKNYLHDFELNSIDFDLNFNIRLFKGFSWRINGRYSIQHNQINIVKPSGQSEIDLFLSQKQFKSGFNYWFNTGITYSFGSIYNTIVNPRFTF